MWLLGINTIYEILFIDGNQYNANVTDRDPINDTTFLTPYFLSIEMTHTTFTNY